jgi:hypothetical protein
VRDKESEQEQPQEGGPSPFGRVPGSLRAR